MIGPWIVVVGFLLTAIAFVIMANTSLGGTRSDYDDGSNFLASFGGLACLAGIVITLVEFLV